MYSNCLLLGVVRRVVRPQHNVRSVMRQPLNYILVQLQTNVRDVLRREIKDVHLL